jgi:hypothetical protein
LLVLVSVLGSFCASFSIKPQNPPPLINSHGPEARK